MNILIPLIKETELTPNQLYLLYCIYVDEKPLHINLYAELRALKNAGCVSQEGKITEKGIEISVKLPVTKKVPKRSSIVITEECVDTYLELFPKGKLPSGRQARADKRNIKTNLEWFFKTYQYDWDTVIKATQLYVDEYERKNFLYMKTSQYFISKMNPDRSRDSELANYCSQIITGDYQDDTNHFSEKVV
jgi:hypothetical protein